MPLFNHLKKKSVPAPEEPKKGVRQLMAEQESGCRIAMLTKQTTIRGEIVEERHAWMIASPDYGASAEKSHPGIQAFVHGQEGKEYASLDSALCALEKALYGFDLSGRKAEPEVKFELKPAPEEPKAALPEAKLPDPSVRITIDPINASAAVTCDRVGFDGGDPTGTYGSIEEAVEVLGEAITDPYAKKSKWIEKARKGIDEDDYEPKILIEANVKGSLSWRAHCAPGLKAGKLESGSLTALFGKLNDAVGDKGAKKKANPK